MKGKKFVLTLLLTVAMSLAWGSAAEAANPASDAGINVQVEAVGQYINWDGVTNVAQFKGTDGNLWFAVDSGNVVTIYKTAGGQLLSGTVTLQKQHSEFGTALCDASGNFYVVTGQDNGTDDSSVETVFISKYDASGRHLGTVGDNGSSSLESYYPDGFFTKDPFHAGNCDAAISGNLLSVHYARLMYNGHQSNSVFTVDIRDLSKINDISFYESHSFAQRVVPTANGFVYMSEGDCYNRTFQMCAVDLDGTTVIRSNDGGTFDFWVEDGAHERYNMSQVNRNFAHMGGITALSNGQVVLVATSAKSLSQAVYNESEEIFIQIFDPYGDLSTPGAYVTSGTRSGLAGPDGRDEVTNYGVKWLTDLGTDYSIENVQLVSTEDHKLVVLYECSENKVEYGSDGSETIYYGRDQYYGVYYIVLDENGNVLKPATLFASNARLNPCETPVCKDGQIYWVGNMEGDANFRLFLFALDPMTNKTAASLNTAVTAKQELVYNGSAQALVTPGAAEGGTLLYALGGENGELMQSRFSTAIPTATVPGTYTVYYYVQGDSAHLDTVPAIVTVEVSKAPVTFEEAPNDLWLTYTGQPQELVIPGRTNVGTVKYRIGTDYTDYAYSVGLPSAEGFSAAIPTATDAGEYYIWYLVEETDCYEGCLGSLITWIRKADISYAERPQGRELYYTGQPQELVTAGRATYGSVLYAVTDEARDPEEEEYSTQIPRATEVGLYVVHYKVLGDENHSDSAFESCWVWINPASDDTPENSDPGYNPGSTANPNPGTTAESSYTPDPTSESPANSTPWYVAYGLSGTYVPAGYADNSGSPMIIEGKQNYTWNYAGGKAYWYENGIKQGTYYDPKGVVGDGSNRGREICDPACDGWFWLDACYDGAKAVGKEVWIPYIYQDEDQWDDAKKWEIAHESDPGMGDLVYTYMTTKQGKWVRYDENGQMCKGWIKIEGALAEKYPDQEGNEYYYDTRTGLMAKGLVVLEGVEHYFDETTGVKVY